MRYSLFMLTRVALLRAVNVGGRKLAMAELRQMLESLGLKQVDTVLQSGNAVFRDGPSNGFELESLLEAETEKRLKLRTDYLVRTADEWDAIVSGNPFPHEARSDPCHLLALPCKTAPAPSDVAALRSAIRGREAIRALERELFAYYPDGIGTSKLTIPLIERQLKTRCTGRNWNTVLKIQTAIRAAYEPTL
jgi:uncharacterized protein (DUF1697 family)